MIILSPGDVVFKRGQSPISWAIRLCSTSPGEGKTLVNHVAIVSIGGTLGEAKVVEAVSIAREISLVDAIGNGAFAIYRPRGLSMQERMTIVMKARSYVGRHYGYGKVAAHLGDWILTRLTGRSVYAFRRLAKMDRYPMCSWLLNHSFATVGISFGEAPDPDDIWDDVKANLIGWSLVRGLAPIRRSANGYC